MDIHATLMNLIQLEKNDKNYIHENGKREISLFNEISIERTCDDAGIEPHYCAQFKKTEIKPDKFINELSIKFINILNEQILKDHLDVCSRIKLKNIDNVFLLETSIKKKSKIKVNYSKAEM